MPASMATSRSDCALRPRYRSALRSILTTRTGHTISSMSGGFLVRLSRMHQFSALRHRGFRLLWTDTLLSATARWADMVVIGWLTLEVTNSPLMVGIVTGSKMAGYFAAPFMGVIADRMDKRRLLIGASVVNLAVSILMLFLFATGTLALW